MADEVTRTMQIRADIQTQLLTKCASVVYGRYKGTFPSGNNYVVWTLDGQNSGEVVDQATVTIHVVGEGQNTNDTEKLADDIWNLFDHYQNGSVGFEIYRNTRGMMMDDNAPESILRRLVFTIRIYN